LAEKARQSSYVLSISAGLCAALVVSGAALMVVGFRPAPDCAGLNPEVCAAQQEVAEDFAKYELGLGFGFLSLGAGGGLWLWLDRRRKAAKG